MRALTLGCIAAATMVSGCTGAGLGGLGLGGGDAGYGRYDYDRPDPAAGGYYADRYYRQGNNYRERRLSQNDRVYVGRDGRYYCRRPDGTTGLIIGGIAGGVLGNIIAPGGSQTLGTILGGAAGAVGGRAIERNNVRCR